MKSEPAKWWAQASPATVTELELALGLAMLSLPGRSKVREPEWVLTLLLAKASVTDWPLAQGSEWSKGWAWAKETAMAKAKPSAPGLAQASQSRSQAVLAKWWQQVLQSPRWSEKRQAPQWVKP